MPFTAPTRFYFAALGAMLIAGCGESQLAVSSATSQRAPITQTPSQAIWVTTPTVVTKSQFFQTYATRLGLGANDSMVLHKESPSKTAGLTFARYHQLYRALPVIGGEYNLTHKAGNVVSGIGHIVSGLNLATTPTITAAQALTTCKNQLAADLHVALSSIVFYKTPSAVLAFLSLGNTYQTASYRLGYRCALAAKSPHTSYLVDVDAGTGAVLQSTSIDMPSPTTVAANGIDLYGKSQAFTALYDPAETPLVFRLQNAKQITLNMLNQSLYTNAIDYTSDSNFFTEPVHYPGVSVHWGMQSAMEYFSTTFQNDCLSFSEGAVPYLTSYVDVGGLTYAKYTPDDHDFSFPTAPSGLKQLTAVGHEYTHCILLSSTNWDTSLPYPYYGTEGGALSESFADIFGDMIELATIQTTDLKSLGESLCDPLSHAAPDTWKGVNWHSLTPTTEANDWGGIHVNGRVQSLWFCMVSKGKAGTSSTGINYDLHGMGYKDAASLLYTSYIEKLWPSATYPDARDATVLSAIEACGEFSLERVRFENAWYVTGVQAAEFTNFPWVSPAMNATNVDPWDTVLKWQANGEAEETAWDVQISTSTDYTADLKSFDNVTTTMLEPTQNNMKVGTLTVTLDPGRIYYWHVRRHVSPASPFPCWRAGNMLSTQTMKVTLVSPSTPAGGTNTYYPWDLDFIWQFPHGYHNFTVQVATDAQFGQQLFPEVTTTAKTVQRDVLKGKSLFWRVRPNFKASDGTIVPGAWTQTSFTTTVPAVALISPTQGQMVYPWPVPPLTWQPVVGAESYILELKLATSKWGDSWGEPQAIPLPKTQTSYALLNLRANEANLKYDWRVRAIGPKIGPTPPSQTNYVTEEATPMELYFIINHFQTIIYGGKPDLTSCPESAFIDVEFFPIVNATKYTIDHAEAVCVQNQLCSVGLVWPTVTDLAQAGVSKHKVAGFTGPTATKDSVGFFWKAQAFGPNGLPGFPPSGYIEQYLVQPPPPDMLDPPGGTEVEEGKDLTLSWQTAMTHGGKFVLAVYKGDDSYCTTAPDFSTVVSGNASHGTFSTTLTNLQVDESDKTRHSWRVRPFIYDWQSNAPCKKPQWSTCQTFKVKPKTPPPPPPVGTPSLPCHMQQGGGDHLEFYWYVVNGADSYNVDIYQGGVFFGETDADAASAAGVASLAGYDTAVYGGATMYLEPPSSYIGIYDYRVRAVKGGQEGNYSEWGHYYFGLANPSNSQCVP